MVYGTDYVRTGWGTRSLVDCEKAAAFDLPSWLDWDDSMATTALPLKMCHALLDSMLSTNSNSEAPVQRITPKRRAPPSKELSAWLPRCCTTQNPTWALARSLMNQSTISAKAVKSDDTAVDFAI
jgi:hypothetical protein